MDLKVWAMKTRLEPIFAKNPNFGVENSSSTGSSSNNPILAIQTDENSGLEAAIGAAPNNLWYESTTTSA
jgi:hypothetical protein